MLYTLVLFLKTSSIYNKLILFCIWLHLLVITPSWECFTVANVPYKFNTEISCSVPAKGDSINGHGMCEISFNFLTTDNWIKLLKYCILIGLNQLLPKNARSFTDYSPETLTIKPIGQNLLLWKFGETSYVSNVSCL